MADLSDLEDQKETHHHLVLYEAALLELTHGNIPCRTLRSVMKSYIVYVYPFVSVATAHRTRKTMNLNVHFTSRETTRNLS